MAVDDNELQELHRYQIDLEIRGQLLFEKYMSAGPPSTEPSGLMGREKIALLMRDVGVLQLEDNDRSAVLQELELADADEDCMLDFPEFVTFTRYLSQRQSLNKSILQIIHDEYEEARRRTVFRNFCDVDARMWKRGLFEFLKALKVFKIFNKFDRTMIWTASNVTKSGSAEEYIPYKSFVSTTIPMIAAKVFAGGRKSSVSTSEAISKLWREVDREYINICKHAEQRNVLVQLMKHEEKLLMRAFVGADSVIDLAEVHKLLNQVPDCERAPPLAQLVSDLLQEECEDGSSELLFTEFISVVPSRFVVPLETGCIISLGSPKPPSVERSEMHPRDLEVIFRHFDVGKKGTIHFGQLEDMMTALKLRHKLKDLQQTLSSSQSSSKSAKDEIDIAELMALLSKAGARAGERPESNEDNANTEEQNAGQPEMNNSSPEGQDDDLVIENESDAMERIESAADTDE